MANLPLISIVTVNFNGLLQTEALLNSLQKISYAPIETFVVDNGSSESLTTLQAKFPEVVFIFSKENLGFAGGNNLAIEQAKGKYLLLLNNDTEVDATFLEPMVLLMEANEKIGVVSSKLLYFNNSNTLQYAGSTGINKYTGRGFAIGFNELDADKYTKSYQTQLAHGAAMMIRKKTIESIGLMAELFFLYYEEVDFCERVKRAGFEIWYCGASKVFHKESMSVGKESPLQMYYLTRNRLIFMRRNSKGLELLSALLFFVFISYPIGFLRLLLKGELSLLWAFNKGLFWNLFHHGIFENKVLKKL